ncbi:MAG: tripartite tricarboxylate transporter substrate-binding protein [Acetobacteraceae bacterium]
MTIRAMLVLAILVAGLASARAKDDQPITMVVAYTAGGTTDVVARILAARLSDKLGQSVIVEDRPGATGQIAARFVARSSPDGHVIMIATQTTHAVAPNLYKSIGYSPVKDFTPITLAVWTPLVLVTNPSFPPTTVAEMIAYLKSHPGKVTYATGGRGDGSHIAALLFDKDADVSPVAVPYQGEGPAMPAVLANTVPYMFCSAPTVQGVIASGQLKALAVTSKVRTPVLADVPTLQQEGLKDYDMENWWGFFGPAGMTPDTVARFSQARPSPRSSRNRRPGPSLRRWAMSSPGLRPTSSRLTSRLRTRNGRM